MFSFQSISDFKFRLDLLLKSDQPPISSSANFSFIQISDLKEKWQQNEDVNVEEEVNSTAITIFTLNQDSAVKSGRIQIDGKTVPVSYRVQSSQKISHFLHRHEPPVMALDVAILHKGEDVLTVCKPASVPVHPCGQYRKNTVVGILQAEHDLAPLFPIHRLDRLVSGLLILARSASQAEIFRQQIESGMIQKQYIAKVVGEFPEEEQVVNLRVNFNAREGRSTVEEDTDEKADSALKGKAACTKFSRICTNGKFGIVSCHPITGRTHQAISRWSWRKKGSFIGRMCRCDASVFSVKEKEEKEENRS